MSEPVCSTELPGLTDKLHQPAAVAFKIVQTHSDDLYWSPPFKWREGNHQSVVCRALRAFKFYFRSLYDDFSLSNSIRSKVRMYA